MPTTQYIGSRYVPLLADPIEWSSTKEYEPLTIVTHEGNSYTSRQFVPKGIDIHNEAFWALTGNYNAQIEQYRRETEQAVESSREYTDAAVAQVDEWLTDAQDKYGAKAFAFDTVEAMQRAYDLLYTGAICHTNGFRSNGDNGAAWYVISDAGLANNMDVIACGNLFANLIVTEPCVTPEMFGAYGNGVTDDTTVMEKCLTYPVVSCKQGATYLVNQPIAVNGNVCLYGNSSKLLLATQYTDIDEYVLGYTNKNGIVIKDLSIVTQSHDLTDFSVPGGHSKTTGETSSGWHGIRFRHCSNVLVQNCYFEGVTFGIAVLPGTYTSDKINASQNITILGNYFYNVKNCYIFEYCNYVNFDGNKHILDIPASDGYHIYYLEAYIGHVTISNEISIYDPKKPEWLAYDFASYGGEEENVGRVISMTNVQAIAPRFFGTYGNHDIEANGCTFKSNCVSNTLLNFLFLNKADASSIRFNSCRFIGSENAPNMLLLVWDTPTSECEAIFDSCYIEVPRLLLYSTDSRYLTNYATFKSCKLIAKNSSVGLTPVPVHGYLRLIDCDIQGDIGYTPSFITGQNVACDSVVNISKCVFTTFVSSGPAAIIGVISNMPTINVFGCQLLAPNAQTNPVLFRTQPTNKANNYTNYTLDA